MSLGGEARLRNRRCPAQGTAVPASRFARMIRKLASGEYRLYSKKKDPETGKRRNLGTFDTKQAAKDHEKDVQYFKRH
jgi:hypothetical protein